MAPVSGLSIVITGTSGAWGKGLGNHIAIDPEQHDSTQPIARAKDEIVELLSLRHAPGDPHNRLKRG